MRCGGVPAYADTPPQRMRNVWCSVHATAHENKGSACHKGKPSHVYAALKLPKPQLDGILRISFSYDTAREDVDALVQGLKEAQAQLFTSLS